MMPQTKLPITTILYALGFTKEKIIDTFYSKNKFEFDKESKMWSTKFIPENYKRPIKIPFDLIDSKTKKKFLNKGEKLNYIIAKKLKEKNLSNILIPNSEIIGKYLALDLKERSGDYQAKDLKKVMDKPVIIGDAVHQYKKH